MAPLGALAAGLAYPLGFAPFDFWPATLVAAALLFRLLRRDVGRGLWLGWCFGVGKYAAGTSWIYVSIHEHGHAAPPLAVVLVALFVAGMALFHAAGGWLYVIARARPAGLDALVFAAVWVVVEWLLTWLLTGFPWLLAGYALLDTPLAALAPVTGVLGISLAAVGSACLLATLSRNAHRAALVGAALPWLAAVPLATLEWTSPGAPRTVALVQGNIAQEVKWRPESRERIIDTYTSLSEPAWHHDLVIWPEASITLYYHQARELLAGLAARAGGALVLGIPYAERNPDGWTYYNAAAAVGREADGIYRKQRLVPFGEYVPLEGLLRGVIDFFNLPMSRMSRGEPGQAGLSAGDLRMALAICYEIVYPELVRRSAFDADVIVTLSNDTWFGASIGPLQHLQMARMRALENGRYVLRATNNGITAVIDHRGGVIAQLPQFDAAVLSAEFRPAEGHTPFSRIGAVPLVAALLIALFMSTVTAFRREGAQALRK